MSKQTAVMYFINELKKSKDFQRVINEVNLSSTSVRDIIQEALQMEREQIVYTDKYALILSDEEIKENEWFVPISGVGWDLNVPRLANSIGGYSNDHCKKIIAHLPLTDDAPILEGVPLLPPLPQGEDDEELAKEEAKKLHDKNRHEDWDIYDELVSDDAALIKIGFNKAKEKYRHFTGNEIKQITREEAQVTPHFQSANGEFFTIEFQSLNHPSRSTHFECEMEITHEGNETYSTDLMDIGVSNLVPINTPKTTTNSQGQQVACGNYIFE
jgi:hypothetical protein